MLAIVSLNVTGNFYLTLTFKLIRFYKRILYCQITFIYQNYCIAEYMSLKGTKELLHMRYPCMFAPNCVQTLTGTCDLQFNPGSERLIREVY